MLESIGYSVCGIVSDGIAALEMTQSMLPDLVFAEAILPGLDGPRLAERIYSLPLSRYPAIVLSALPGAMIPASEFIENGIAAVISKPVFKDKLMEVLPMLAPEKRRISPDRVSMLEKLMDDLGVPAHRGRNYLIHGICLAWLDNRYAHSLKSRLYPAIAAKFGVTCAHAERAIRYVIDYAWRTGEIEKQHKIFGDTIDARRGKPTCGEMIARLADILRWEGR